MVEKCTTPFGERLKPSEASLLRQLAAAVAPRNVGLLEVFVEERHQEPLDTNVGFAQHLGAVERSGNSCRYIRSSCLGTDESCSNAFFACPLSLGSCLPTATRNAMLKAGDFSSPNGFERGSRECWFAGTAARSPARLVRAGSLRRRSRPDAVP